MSSDSDSDNSVPRSTLPLTLKQFKNTEEYTDYDIVGPRYRKMNIPWHDSLEALTELTVPATDSNGWVPAEHSLRTVRRMWPVFKTEARRRNIGDYKLLFAFQRACPERGGAICIKGALQHRKTGDVVMLTTINATTDVNKPKASHEEGWTVFGVDMIAPACFWNAFKAC